MRYNIIKTKYGVDNMSKITNHERFTVVHVNFPQMAIRGEKAPGEHWILKDNETGVLYYMVNTSGQNAGVGLTPLLGADGKPIVEPVE